MTVELHDRALAVADRLVETCSPLTAETTETEWGVAYERGGICNVTACDSQQAARQLQAASGGGLVYRTTYVTSWSLPAREARPAPGTRMLPASASDG